METVKAYLNDKEEIREFFWDFRDNFEHLKQKIATTFSIPVGHLSIRWIDDEGDHIHVSSDEELYLMINTLKQRTPHGGIVKLFVIGRASASENTHVHERVTCDECQAAPIRGNRFKCLVCPDYDLCDKCLLSGKHTKHDMMLLRNASRQEHYHHLPHSSGRRGERCRFRPTTDGDEQEVVLDFPESNLSRTDYETVGRTISEILSESGIQCSYSVEGEEASTVPATQRSCSAPESTDAAATSTAADASLSREDDASASDAPTAAASHAGIYPIQPAVPSPQPMEKTEMSLFQPTLSAQQTVSQAPSATSSTRTSGATALTSTTAAHASPTATPSTSLAAGMTHPSATVTSTIPSTASAAAQPSTSSVAGVTHPSTAVSSSSTAASVNHPFGVAPLATAAHQGHYPMGTWMPPAGTGFPGAGYAPHPMMNSWYPPQPPRSMPAGAPVPPHVASSRAHMMNMGFNDERGWLTDLLIYNNGDISKCLDHLQQHRK